MLILFTFFLSVNLLCISGLFFFFFAHKKSQEFPKKVLHNRDETGGEAEQVVCLLVKPFFLFLLSKLSWENESKQYLYHRLSSPCSHDYDRRRTLRSTNYPPPGCLSHLINFVDVCVHKNETKPTFPAKAIKEYIHIDIHFSPFARHVQAQQSPE